MSRRGPCGPGLLAARAAAWLERGGARATVVALVRHGDVANPGGLRYGRMDGFALSPRGRAQAEALAAALQPLAGATRLLATSPLQRARETAQPIARALGLDVTEAPPLIEAWSALDGQPRAAWLRPSRWPLLARPCQPSWGEPFAAVAARALAAVVAAERQARGGVAVLISHQSPIWLATLAAERVGPGRVARLLRPLPPWLVRPLRCPTGSATLLCYHDGALVTACPPWRPPAAQARPGG